MDIYESKTDDAIVRIISPEVALGRKQTQEEVDEILGEIALINFKIASRLYKEGKLATTN